MSVLYTLRYFFLMSKVLYILKNAFHPGYASDIPDVKSLNSNSIHAVNNLITELQSNAFQIAVKYKTDRI